MIHYHTKHSPVKGNLSKHTLVLLFLCIISTVRSTAQDFKIVGIWKLESLEFLDPEHIMPQPTSPMDSAIRQMRLEEARKMLFNFDSTGHVTGNEPGTVKYEFLTPAHMEMGHIIYEFVKIDDDTFTLTESRANGRIKAVMRLKRIKTVKQ